MLFIQVSDKSSDATFSHSQTNKSKSEVMFVGETSEKKNRKICDGIAQNHEFMD